MQSANTTSQNYHPNQYLRRLRLSRGWSQQDLADKIGVPDAGTIGRWERGITCPSPVYRQQLCELFEKSAEELRFVQRTLGESEGPSLSEEPTTQEPQQIFDPSFYVEA